MARADLASLPQVVQRSVRLSAIEQRDLDLQQATLNEYRPDRRERRKASQRPSIRRWRGATRKGPLVATARCAVLQESHISHRLQAYRLHCRIPRPQLSQSVMVITECR
jgi:hypothetical protein